MTKYTRVMDSVAKIVFILTGAMVSAMVLIITLQVFDRFVLNHTPRWSEELTIVLMIYTGFLGASLAYRERLHIGIKVFIERVPQPWRARLYFLIDVFIGLFALFMLFWGTGFSWMMRNNTMPATKLSVGVTYLPIPLAGLLILAFVVEKLIRDVMTARTGGDGAGPTPEGV